MSTHGPIPPNHIWQIMPSMAFKTGLYGGVTTIAKARYHGNFGLGQFAALDGELIVHDGQFVRARADGSVKQADDADELCFAQLCFYEPTNFGDAPANVDKKSFGSILSQLLAYQNSFCAFRIMGTFAQVVPSAPPPMPKPYPRFDQVGPLRKSFPAENIAGCIVGYYSPVFMDEVGVAGYHFHFVSDNQKVAGHVDSFKLAKGRVDAARIDHFTITLPTDAAYDAAKLP